MTICSRTISYFPLLLLEIIAIYNSETEYWNAIFCFSKQVVEILKNGHLAVMLKSICWALAKLKCTFVPRAMLSRLTWTSGKIE